MGNGVRVPVSAVRGGRLITKADPVEVKVLKLRYCSNRECKAYGSFWRYKEPKEQRHCPACSEKAVNHTLDSEQRREMLQAFSSQMWSYGRGEVVWRMVGVLLRTEKPMQFSLNLIPQRLFVGYVDAGARVAVFARPVLRDRLSADEAEAITKSSENLRVLVEAVVENEAETEEVKANG